MHPVVNYILYLEKVLEEGKDDDNDEKDKKDKGGKGKKITKPKACFFRMLGFAGMMSNLWRKKDETQLHARRESMPRMRPRFLWTERQVLLQPELQEPVAQPHPAEAAEIPLRNHRSPDTELPDPGRPAQGEQDRRPAVRTGEGRIRSGLRHGASAGGFPAR